MGGKVNTRSVSGGLSSLVVSCLFASVVVAVVLIA